MQRKLAGCIITDKQRRILLLHRNTAKRQQWEIPGGKVEGGEAPTKAAIREAKEELGVIVDVDKLLGERTFTEDGFTLHYTWFRAQIIEGEPSVTEPDTFNNLRYFSLDELRAMFDE